jgi:hypothetical protein
MWRATCAYRPDAASTSRARAVARCSAPGRSARPAGWALDDDRSEQAIHRVLSRALLMAVRAAVWNQVGLESPEGVTAVFEFRSCPVCVQVNIINEDFVCPRLRRRPSAGLECVTLTVICDPCGRRDAGTPRRSRSRATRRSWARSAAVASPPGDRAVQHRLADGIRRVVPDGLVALVGFRPHGRGSKDRVLPGRRAAARVAGLGRGPHLVG